MLAPMKQLLGRDLGRAATLVVRTIDATAARLSPEGSDDTIPLPANEFTTLEVGAKVDVFVYLDSEDRPIATTRTPRLALGEVAFLMVTDLAPFGAFVAWGLKKDLLVPLKEQTRAMRVGQSYAIGLYVDDTDRLAGTMRVAEMLPARGDYANDQWVEGVAWREEPGIGLFVILEKKCVALLPETEPHTLRPGDAARFRITHVHVDRKIEVSLRGLKQDELESDATKILDMLTAPAPPRINDDASPEQIRGLFGISKKAFKRAIGRLLKSGRVAIGDDGFLRAT
jgi:predicted RNA-binding protein (virulence factor B family)